MTTAGHMLVVMTTDKHLLETSSLPVSETKFVLLVYVFVCYDHTMYIDNIAASMIASKSPEASFSKNGPYI